MGGGFIVCKNTRFWEIKKISKKKNQKKIASGEQTIKTPLIPNPGVIRGALLFGGEGFIIWNTPDTGVLTNSNQMHLSISLGLNVLITIRSSRA